MGASIRRNPASLLWRSNIVQRINIAMFFALVAAFLVVLVSRPGHLDAQSEQQIVVATVDLESVINNLNELPVREQALQSFIDQKQADLQALVKDFESAQAAAEAAVPGSQDYQTKLERVQRLGLRAELEKQFSEQLIAQRRAQTFADLFEKIRSSSQALATQRGYEIVLNSDEAMAVPSGNEQQIRAFMISRRVLYAANHVDISGELLQMMNNQWDAGRTGRNK
jgi:Skp family chaperone for outer membrane proteins